MEFVFCRHEGLTRKVSDLLRDDHAELLGSVDARADGGAAQRQGIKRRERGKEHCPPLGKHGAPAADLLREANGGGVLQVRSAAFNDILVFFFYA